MAINDDALLPLLSVANSLFNVQRRGVAIGDDIVQRHGRRALDALEQLGLFVESPLGESFSETRTDVEAHISGASTENLRITDVLKPIVRLRQGPGSTIVQKGIVVVTAATEGESNV